MDIELWAVFIGIIAGAVGYWFSTFVMQPILRFREIKNQILMDFIYYAQVINADDLNDEMKALFRERILANRKKSAQLSAAAIDLPQWYLNYLKRRGVAPLEAAQHLIGYSNTTEHEQAHKVQVAIRRKLGLPPEV